MNKILIYGAGGLGRGIIELIESINREVANTWEILGFVDDQAKDTINGIEIWGTTEDLLILDKPISVVLALGNPNSKKTIYNRLKANSKINYPNLIHPSVEISRFNIIGHGNLISKGVSMSTNIKLKNFNLIHYNCSIGHDVSMDNYNSIFPLTSLSGYVTIENEVEIGANSTVLPSLSIKEKARVGAGAVVTRNVLKNTTVIGVPAKKLE